MTYEKTYELVAANRESDDIVVLQLLDKAGSTPNAVKSVFVRLGVNDFLETFGDAPVCSKVKVSVEVVEKAKKIDRSIDV